MCKQHIQGEHYEIHLHRHNFVKKHSISGRIKPIVQIEPLSMKKRHDELAKYMNHKSPYVLPDLSHLSKEELNAKVNITIIDLKNKIKKKKNILKY